MVALSDHQGRAVKRAANWYRSTGWRADQADLFYLAGFAGTGKSTILPDIITDCGVDPETVLYVAPTGKAAKIMTQKMRQMGMSATATTIHKAIYRPKMLKADVLSRNLAASKEHMAVLVSDGDPSFAGKVAELKKTIQLLERDLEKAYDSDELNFQLNVDAEKIRESSLVVVDEASMVNEEMAEDLRSFGVPVMAIGDPGQLPPVSGNAGLCVGDPDAFLTEIHRQAADNPIIRFATQLRNEEFPEYGKWGDELQVIRRKNDDRTFDIESDAQIICGKNDTRWRITTKLRDLMGYGPTGPVRGEPMIITKNSLKHASLVNGTLAWCTDDVGMLEEGDSTFYINVVDEDDTPHKLACLQGVLEEHYLGKNSATCGKYASFHAKKVDDQIDWAYALTCHKMQGSQADNVVVHDEGAVFRRDVWRWRYTAATRAAKTLTWVM